MGGVGRDSGGIVLPRETSAVDIRTGGIVGMAWFEVDCGLRLRGRGATSPAPRMVGTALVTRGGLTFVVFGDANKSAPGSLGACLLLFTRLISSFTAVDSVFAIFQTPKTSAARIANGVRRFNRNQVAVRRCFGRITK